MLRPVKAGGALVGSLLGAALLTSCGEKDTHEKIMEDTLGLMERVVAVVEEVQDKDTAEAAAEKLDDMVGDFEKVAERIDAIGDPDEETEKALKEKFEKRGEELIEKMMSSMVAVATMDPSMMQTLQAPMEKIGTVMEKVR